MPFDLKKKKFGFDWVDQEGSVVSPFVDYLMDLSLPLISRACRDLATTPYLMLFPTRILRSRAFLMFSPFPEKIDIVGK